MPRGLVPLEHSEDDPDAKVITLLSQDAGCRPGNCLGMGPRLFLAREAVAREGALGKRDKPSVLAGRFMETVSHNFEVAVLVREPAVHLNAGDLPGSHVASSE